MKKYYRSWAFLVSAFAVTALVTSVQAFPTGPVGVQGAIPQQQNLLRIGDGPRFPLPKETTQPPVQEIIDAKLQARFDAATARSNHLLTAKTAHAASWGFVADHFAGIDKNKDGYATLSEISAFLDARSPVKRKAAEKSIRLVE
ncbi:hypothetical protein [Phyllobacterium zundukense]|uniref:Uncharacterized protein n=1 Tax=Phyllobacterium zundukense TaxID=1867719 RepID=A0ACD4D3N8_9HYPH|nr:hypothetical protein [Phyllobacterium zundukense]UXN60462.1 hypothetical protein N8E88_28890 [Phyllobacterium zundukense]